MNEQPSGPFLEVTGPTGDRRIELDQHQVVDIGRGTDNALTLISQQVSRRHALIRKRGDRGYTVLDLGSRNGTEVNGRRIQTEVDLADGDRIQIGEYSIVFRLPAADALAAHAETNVEDGATRLVVNQRSVSVVVMDLRDYTGLSRRIDTTRLGSLLAALSARATLILTARGAWSYKMIGDAVMAVWVHESLTGAPHELRQALNATIEIAAVIGQLGRQFELDRELTAGAAISTGEASLGGLGAQGKVEVVGDTVNLAFRLEAATRSLGYDLLVSEATRYILGKAPPEMFTEHKVDLKGFAEPVRAFGLSFEPLKNWLAVG